jgi:protein gp37
MSLHSNIEWTETTWNPVTGCTKISSGCRHCYAERMARRLKAMGQPNYRNGFRPTVHLPALEIPLRIRKPQRIFVNSMGDLFHEAVPLGFIKKVFQVMEKSPQHQFQVLTKRAERLAKVADDLSWPGQVWIGVSIEDERYVHRIDYLRQVPAAVRFLSLEPLLGPLPSLDLRGIDWVIVGGESGPGARPLQAEWVKDIRDQCLEDKVPFFFKQWGGFSKKKNGRELEGRVWDAYPLNCLSK